ncbi:hypothetical protein PTTG_27918 [Puccinia triticina 1-1 BBBD Race 1]|uniref:Uncharacterized protein n=2 Tax=Puccinia triticina TaxID=208348 RepID=A0A180GFR6_PUCT1|nr:uncharacterized protein PtA15_1A190 [Puccinia triticina]OAV91566.1 hypothetical protein PTTG_27918 [Puccinia triticina 1-1 BBBD Race 1]WAQ80852.1 hypothetical protein PtA15_1A190 [Puccinia triticina]
MGGQQIYGDIGRSTDLSFKRARHRHPKKVWILKPAVADKAQGIRLFRSREELYEIFTDFERLEELEESQELDDPQKEDTGVNDERRQTWVSVSQMRDWIIQEYVSNPLLIDPAKPETYSTDKSVDQLSFHKHHLSVYVLAVGALSVSRTKVVQTVGDSPT